MFVDLPPMNWEPTVAWLEENARVPNTEQGRSIFAGGARVGFHPPHGEALLHYMAPTASKATGRELHGSYAFGWLYPRGAWLAPHLDRPSVFYLFSITIDEDEPWALEIHEGPVWRAIPTKVGRAVLIDGALHAHRRPVYTGDRSIALILSYCQTPEIAAHYRRDIPYITGEEKAQAAAELGLDVHSLPGFRKPVEVFHFDCPIPAGDIPAVSERVRARLWHSGQDTSADVLTGLIGEDVLALQMGLLDVMRGWTGKPVVAASPWGICYRKPNAEFRRHPRPLEDWTVAIPLDENSAQARLFVRQNADDAYASTSAMKVDFGNAVVFPGYPSSMWLEPNSWANWAVLGFQEVPE